MIGAPRTNDLAARTASELYGESCQVVNILRLLPSTAHRIGGLLVSGNRFIQRFVIRFRRANRHSVMPTGSAGHDEGPSRGFQPYRSGEESAALSHLSGLAGFAVPPFSIVDPVYSTYQGAIDIANAYGHPGFR